MRKNIDYKDKKRNLLRKLTNYKIQKMPHSNGFDRPHIHYISCADGNCPHQATHLDPQGYIGFCSTHTDWSKIDA